jgi:hypothetical protein
MILATIAVTPSIIESLTKTLGGFPLHLTDKDVLTTSAFQYELRGVSGNYGQGSPLRAVIGYLLQYSKLTVSLDGENLTLEETPHESITGNARSTGIFDVDKARQVHYRNHGTIITNPVLPEAAQPAVTSADASTGDADKNRNRGYHGTVPGTSCVLRNPA